MLKIGKLKPTSELNPAGAKYTASYMTPGQTSFFLSAEFKLMVWVPYLGVDALQSATAQRT